MQPLQRVRRLCLLCSGSFQLKLSLFRDTGIKKIAVSPNKKTVLNTRGTGRAESTQTRATKKRHGKIKQCNKVIILADKTRNLYVVSKVQYDKLLRDNITKSYRPAPGRTYHDINVEARDIARSLEVADRMNCMQLSLSDKPCEE